MIKIVTGMHRCGKSYPLLYLFREHLIQSGIDKKHIVTVDLEDRRNKKLCNPEYIDNQIIDSQMHFLLDEIQHVSEFEDVLSSYIKLSNVDVTGSNSKLLSSDIIIEFQDRGYEMRIHPLCFNCFNNSIKKLGFKHFLCYI